MDIKKLALDKEFKRCKIHVGRFFAGGRVFSASIELNVLDDNDKCYYHQFKVPLKENQFLTTETSAYILSDERGLHSNKDKIIHPSSSIVYNNNILIAKFKTEKANVCRSNPLL